MAGPAARIEYSLLPPDRTFSGLLPAFLFPYMAYVGLGSASPDLMSAETAGLLRSVCVAALLWFFRKRYRFGPPLTPRMMGIGLAAALGAFILWAGAYRLSLALPWWHGHLASAESARPSVEYWIFRTVNSTLLVPVFEELFCRAYLGELFLAAPPGAKGLSEILGRRMDSRPVPLDAPPLSRTSVLGSTLLFTLGHDASAWIPAVLYFGFTTWVYRRTRSFAVCVLIHALTNLAIAVAVWRNPRLQFFWF